MKRFLRRFWLLIVLAILIAVFIVYPALTTVTTNPSDGGAQSNIITALTGVRTSGPDWLAESPIDTGISEVTNASTDSNHVLSIHVGGNGPYVIQTAFSPGTNNCWGILYVTRHCYRREYLRTTVGMAARIFGDGFSLGN